MHLSNCNDDLAACPSRTFPFLTAVDVLLGLRRERCPRHAWKSSAHSSNRWQRHDLAIAIDNVSFFIEHVRGVCEENTCRPRCAVVKLMTNEIPLLQIGLCFYGVRIHGVHVVASCQNRFQCSIGARFTITASISRHPGDDASNDRQRQLMRQTIDKDKIRQPPPGSAC